MHADVFVVLKSGVKADLFLTESERIKYSSFKVETNLDKALYEDWNWSQWWIAGVGPMLGLIVGLATMPDLSHGISARETWVVVCMLGGFLAALALYGIVYGIISLLKRKR
jgi:glycerol uptake facilitator-like aquaporin